MDKMMTVNINEVTKRELVCWYGVGTQTAERIIAYREDHGRIRDIEELRACEGVEDDLIITLKQSTVTE